MEVETSKRWKKSKRLEDLLEEVHNKLQPEAQGLCPPGHTSLLHAADRGPIVVPLSTPIFSGAIIIERGGQCYQMNLPSETIAWLKNWENLWRREIKEARSYLRGCKGNLFNDAYQGAKLVSLRGDEVTLLKELWDYLVAPIITGLFGHQVRILATTLKT